MMTALCNLLHGKCKQKLKDLTIESVGLLNQIQELKATNHYKAWELEQKIVELEKEIAIIKEPKKEDNNG